MAEPPKPKPLPLEELQALVDNYTRDPDFQARDDEYERMRQLVFQDPAREPVIPNVTVGVKWMSPDIERSGFKYQRRMIAAPLKVSVTAVKEGDKAEGRAAKLARFFTRHHTQWLAEGTYDGALFDQATVGAGCLHVTIDPRAIPTVPVPGEKEDVADYTQRVEDFLREKRGTIFKLESVDYATLYHTLADEKRCGVQVSLVPMKPLLEKYGRAVYYTDKPQGGRELIVGEPGSGMPDNTTVSYKDKVELIVIETEEYIYHLVADETGNTRGEGKLAGTYKNYFGRSGFVVFGGDTTRDPRPLRRYRPLVQGMYQSVPHENVMGTLKLAAGVKAGQMQYALEPIDAESTLPEGSVEIRVEDGILIPPDGWRIAAPKLDVGFDLNDAFSIARELTKDYGFPLVLDRPEEVTATAGYDRALQQDTVSSLLDTPLGNWGEAVREVFLMMAHAIREFPLPVVIRTVKTGERMPELSSEVADDLEVGKDDAEELDLAVSFDSVATYTRIGMQEENLKMLEVRQMTETELQRERGIDDIGAWRRLRRRDNIRSQAEKWAEEDALAAVQKLRDAVLGAQVQEQGVDPALAEQAGMVPPEAGLEGMTPSLPTGPGTAMPLTPPPPDELQDVLGASMASGVTVG